MIRLRFVSHPGLFNWAARVAQYGFWSSHVEAVTPDGTYLGAMRDGVKDRPKGYDGGKFLREEFVEVKSTLEQERLFYAFLRNQVGKPYDVRSIAMFYSDRDWQDPNKWYCAELIGGGLAAAQLFPQHMAIKFSHLSVRDAMLLASTLAQVEAHVR